MSRWLRALAIVLLAASCTTGGVKGKAPRNMDNACSILEQRPGYARAFRVTERRWGVPMHIQMATIYQESRFVSNARTPMRWRLGVIPVGRQSTAFGYSQAIDSTWDEYRRSAGSRFARRTDIRDASDFMGWYMSQSNQQLGIALDDMRNQYLAYHEGRTGYRRGTYRNKSWLLRVANDLDARADRYERQLSGCRAARR